MSIRTAWKLFLLPILFFVAGLHSAAALASDFTVKVDGTKGMKYMAHFAVMQDSGASASKSFDGKVPAEYKMQGAMVSVVVMKKAKKGELVVSILKDNKEVARTDTSAEYGSVTIATD